MEAAYPSSLKGQFLIAMPGLLDPNFFQTVSCISEHTAEGAVGLVINRHHALVSAKDIFGELNLHCTAEAESIPVHVGGPVHINEIFVLHGPPFQWQGCLPIIPGAGHEQYPGHPGGHCPGREGPADFLITLAVPGGAPVNWSLRSGKMPG